MKLFKTIIGIALIVSAIVYTCYIKFTNVDMTELRMLMEFWRSWIFIFVILVVGGFLVEWDR